MIFLMIKAGRQVTKSVTRPLLNSEMGWFLWGFRPVLEVTAKHSWPARAANLQVTKWAVTGKSLESAENC